MALLDDVKAYLLVQVSSLAPITQKAMPATPDVAFTIYEYGGSGPETGFGVNGLQYEMPGVQCVARGAPNDYDEPYARIRLAYLALAKLQATTIGSTYVLMARAQQSPFMRSIDGNKRYEFTVNFLFHKNA